MNFNNSEQTSLNFCVIILFPHFATITQQRLILTKWAHINNQNRNIMFKSIFIRLKYNLTNFLLNQENRHIQYKLL